VAVVCTALTGLVVGLHFVYLGVMIFGGLAAYRWRWLLGVHLAAVVWGLGAVILRYDCPLTSVELALRERAGLALYQDGFIRHYIRGELFPERLTPFVVAAMVGLILAGWVRFASRASRRTPASGFR
jgi:hypothetical protein